MAGATPWTELAITDATGYQEGFADYSYDSSTDYFIDFLFEGTAFFAVAPTTYTEITVASTYFIDFLFEGTAVGTELTLGTATPYVELTL